MLDTCYRLACLRVGDKLDEGKLQQKFGLIKQVDNCWITTVKDLENWRFER